MGIDLAKLATQGRAYSPSRAWTEVELEALITLETKCKLSRIKAADFIRNGILTVEAYEKAINAKFEPKTLEKAHTEAEDALKSRGEQAVKTDVASTI